ncbi:MAG: shikimate kinase [Candidatus Dormiibacterota bacterium]
MEGRRPLVLLGFMGSGKTTVGRLAAELAGASFADLDQLIERDAGVSVQEFFRRRGEPAFRAQEAARLLTALTPDSVLAVGGGTPMHEASWAALRQRAVTVWLDAPLPLLLQRADASSRPLLQRHTRSELQELHACRCRRYAEADHRVDSSGPAAVVAEEVVQRWDR